MRHDHAATDTALLLPVSVRLVQLGKRSSGGEGKQDDAAQTRAPRAPANRHSRQNKKAQRTAEAFSLCLIATRRLAVLYACFYFTTSMNQRQIDHAAFADLACVRAAAAKQLQKNLAHLPRLVSFFRGKGYGHFHSSIPRGSFWGVVVLSTPPGYSFLAFLRSWSLYRRETHSSTRCTASGLSSRSSSVTH